MQSEPWVGKRKATTRAKWRSLMSARRGALKTRLTQPTLLEIEILRQVLPLLGAARNTRRIVLVLDCIRHQGVVPLRIGQRSVSRRIHPGSRC
jgi:hypothetical protein